LNDHVSFEIEKLKSSGFLKYEKIVIEHDKLVKMIEEKKKRFDELDEKIKKNHDTKCIDEWEGLNKQIKKMEKSLKLLDLDINKKAFDILQNGDPVEHIINLYNKMHIGDTAIGKILLLSVANTCISNSEGLQPKLSGPSGKGKTHAVNAIFHLIPDDDYKLEGSISAKSLFYNKDLVDGMVIFSDDIEMDTNLESTLKRAMTNFQKKTFHQTLDKDRNFKTTMLPKRISWWLTAVNTDYSDELINRLFDFSVDDSAEQDEEVTKMIFKNAALGIEALPDDEETMICRAIIHIIKRQLFKVIIPFGEDIRWNIKGDRRNPSRFVSLVMGFAVFRYMQRVETGDGAILADIKDYEDAKALYEVGKANQASKLTNAELSLIEWMGKQGKELSINDIVAGYKKKNGDQYTYSAIRKLLNGENYKNKKGLIDKLPGIKIIESGNETKYQIGEFKKFEGEAVSLKGQAP
jgi:hypothetical protein